MAVPRESPSPVIPIIVLLIVGTMMTIPSMMAYDSNYWNDTVADVQTHFVLGAFLIPICLLLAVQAFGLPLVNKVEPRTPGASPFVESITQNLTSSILLVVVIFILLMLIPLRSSLQGPWHPAPPYARRGRW